MKKNSLPFAGLTGFYFAGLLLLAVCAQAQSQSFTLTGTLAGQASGQLKLYYTAKDGRRAVDSTPVKNGRFEFRGETAEPGMVYLESPAKAGVRDNPNATRFFIEPASMRIQLTYNDFKNAVITGSKTQDEYVALAKSKEPI